jgi:hypothetical protein
MSGSINPLIQQGTLNRIRASITFSSFTSLNISSSNMGKSFCSVSFDDPFTDQIGTATGIVNSPAPWVFSTVSVSVLKTQALGSAILTQIGLNTALGTTNVYPDSAAFPTIQVSNASIIGFNPAAYDGTDPTISVTIRGVYYPNSNLWAGL